MPDQSLSNESVSGKTDQTTGDPADTSANSPTQATPESLESNVTRASEGELQQADVTINQDPVIGSGDVQTVGTEGRQASTPAADEYDDEEKYPYRDLQKLAKNRDVDASGKRDEIVARLREQDASGGGSTDVPRASVDPSEVENGGIQRTGFGQAHAEILQGLSAERRQQQLAAVADRSGQSGSGEE